MYLIIEVLIFTCVLKYSSGVLASTWELAISKCIIMCLKDGLFRGFAAQHCLINNLKPSGQDEGIGKCRELLPTPQIIADESTSL